MIKFDSSNNKPKLAMNTNGNHQFASQAQSSSSSAATGSSNSASMNGGVASNTNDLINQNNNLNDLSQLHAFITKQHQQQQQQIETGPSNKENIFRYY